MTTSRRKFLQKSTLATLGITAGVNLLDLQGVGATNIIREKLKFPVSVFSKHLHWLDYQQMAKMVSSLGFDGIDLTVRPEGHVEPEKVKEELPKVVRAIRDAGLEVYMITTAIKNPDDPLTEDILKTAGSLNIPYYRLGWFDFDKNISLEKNIEDFKTRFKKFADLGKKYNICGDYQNHSGTSMGGSIWDLWLALKEENPQWVGCQYDIRHAMVEGAFSWPVGLELIKPYVHTIDIKDYVWRNKDGEWKIENVPLGKGMVEFEKYFNLLKANNISGPISLHYEYGLGGAEHGNRKIAINENEFRNIISNDLKTLKSWLKRYNMES